MSKTTYTVKGVRLPHQSQMHHYQSKRFGIEELS